MSKHNLSLVEMVCILSNPFYKMSYCNVQIGHPTLTSPSYRGSLRPTNAYLRCDQAESLQRTAHRRSREASQPLHPVEMTTMDRSFELTLEQQFNIRSFESQVAHMSLEQAQQFLVELYRQMIVKETMYKEFLKHEWGLGERFQTP